MLQLLWKQLLHDLKASWKKSAVLGMLLLVGLYFWLPMLMDAFAPASQTSAAASAVVPPAAGSTTLASGALASGALASGALAAADSTADATAESTFDWQAASRAAQRDPLLRPASPEEFRHGTFLVDARQFPPPIVFAQADTPRAVARRAVPDAAPSGDELPEGLVLSSTIVSATRRAALINRRVYLEGSRLTYEGRTYQLTSVEPRRVVLRDEVGVFELKIQLPYASGESGY